MTIKIKQEPEIEITKAQYDRYAEEYRQMCMYMLNPPSLETYIRQQEESKANDQ